MPAPDNLTDDDAVALFVTLFRQTHQLLRDELGSLDDDALNWVPMPGANSIATIVTHVVGSEAETIRAVAGVPNERNRESEFIPSTVSRADVLHQLAAADGLVEELAPRIDSSRLEARISLPTLPDDELRSGLAWLVGNYGHAREHVGQIQLTKQLLLS